MPRCCTRNLVLSPPLLCSLLPLPLCFPPHCIHHFPCTKRRRMGLGGAKTTGVNIPRCGDTGDSEEPGPRCHHRGGKRRASHLPRHPPSGGRGSGTQNRHRLPTPPLALQHGVMWRGETEARGWRAQPGFMQVGRSQEGFAAPHQPPLKSLPFSAPQIPPPGSCGAAGCGFARLPRYTQRPLQLIAPPAPRCPAPNCTVPCKNHPQKT